MHATATTALYTLSLHDALPIWPRDSRVSVRVDGGLNRPPLEDSEANRKLFAEALAAGQRLGQELSGAVVDRKSTRLNSSHVAISYAVFCLKKKTYNRMRHYITI